METGKIKKLCIEYFKGRTDYAEELELFEMLSSGVLERSLFDKWEKEWVKNETPSLASVASFSKLQADIRRRKRRRIARTAASVFAAAAVVAAVVFACFYAGSGAGQPHEYIVKTGFREKTMIILPDSTKVWLNSASCLKYSDDFSNGRRAVSLTGEAFFDVTHNPQSPFRVNLSAGSIVVKGTKFNVSAYESERELSAALLEGRIVFCNESVRIDMEPGERVTYDLVSENISKVKADVCSYASWVDGKLDFTDITLEKLFARLSSIYGIKIVYTPEKYQDKTFRIILNNYEESIYNIMDAISFIAPIKYNVRGEILFVEEI